MPMLRYHPPRDDQAAALARARIVSLSGPAAPRGQRHDDERPVDLRPFDEVLSGPAPADEWSEDEPSKGGRANGGLAGARQPGDRLDDDRPLQRDDDHEAVDDGNRTERRSLWLAALSDRLPTALRGGRIGLERAHLTVIGLVVAVALLGAVVLLRLGQPKVVPIEQDVVATGTPVSTAAPPAPGVGVPGSVGPAEPAGGPVVVHVAGLVAKPGVVQVPAGSRVIDAIEAAGGATDEADLTPINLARVLADGEQVLVAAAPPPGAPPTVVGGSSQPSRATAGPTAGATPGALINLNTASVAELETLPGVGPTLAGRIVQWRDEHGGFSTVDELHEVAGIGEQRFGEIAPLVTV